MKKFLFFIFCIFLINLGFTEEIANSKYNDSATIEFSLQNSNGVTYCLYQNVNTIKGFDSKDFDVVAQWNFTRWLRKESNDFSVTWNEKNGAIVILKTNNQSYKTKRGIKVGDSISKLYEIYKDCSLWQQKYDNKVIVGFNKANMQEEEMMTLAFWTEKGFITNIEIVVGENESWINRN